MKTTYPRAVLSAALQAAFTGAWGAAGELPAARRRLARAGAVLSLSAVAAVRAREEDRAEDEEQAAEPALPPALDARRLLVVAASIGLSIGLMAGRRRLEKRWLAALIRDGHPHPHRALALRMGLLTFAGTLPGRLVTVHEERRRRGSE